MPGAPAACGAAVGSQAREAAEGHEHTATSAAAVGVPAADAAAAVAARLADQGADLAAEGEFSAAAALFERSLQLDGGSAAVHEMLAQCRMEAGQDEAAYAAASAAVELQPDWPDALATLGRAARNAGRLWEAAVAFSRYLELAGATEGNGAAAAAAVDNRQQEQLQQGAASGMAAANMPDAAAPATATAGQAVAAGAAAAAIDAQEAAAVVEELAEVRQLLQLQLGHQLGLPGLRLLESHGAAAGPGAVAWEAGALLAWFLVQQGQAAGDACGGSSRGPAGCGASCGGACAQPSGGAAGLPAVAAAGQPPSQPTTQPWLRGSRMLELGSGGTGLVGLAAACLGADVTATDLPTVLPQLETAIAANAGLVAAAGGSIRAAALDWHAPQGALLAPPGGSKEQYSWLLGADLVYSQEPVAALVAAVAAAAARKQACSGEPLRYVWMRGGWVGPGSQAHRPRILQSGTCAPPFLTVS